jgi:hypothetical protein
MEQRYQRTQEKIQYIQDNVVQMTIMSMPISSLEFVHGVGLIDVAIHWKAPTSYHFLFVVALMYPGQWLSSEADVGM